MPKPFIPPVPLLFAQTMLAVSWVALFAAGSTGSFHLGPLGLVWIHAVALGWITTTALAFMVHVVPATTAVDWRYPSTARGAIWVFALGVLTLLFGFGFWQAGVMRAGGVVVLGALTIYACTFAATIAGALRSDDASARAVARAFVLVVTALLIAVVLGSLMTFALAAGRPQMLQLAPIHGTLGVVGWIALLVTGVSARTFNRLIGPADRRRAHVVISTAALAGLLVWITGTATHLPLVAGAGSLALIGAAIAYAGTTMRALRFATAAHRLPREFAGASMVWLIVAALLGAAMLAGADVSAAFLFTLLVGWVGQTLNAHLMHTGIRVMATIVLGEDDETEPLDVLDRRLGIVALWLNQIAVALGLFGLALESGTFVQIAAAAGLAAMVAMAANLRYAVAMTRNRRGPESRNPFSR